MKEADERGNVTEVVIIVVLVLCIVGLIIWRVVDSSQKSNTSDQASQTASKQSDTSTTPGDSTDSNKGYVVIEDWAVRFKAVNGFSVRYYKAPANSTANELYEFSTPTIEALNGCSGKNDSGRINGYAGGVERTTEKYDLENMASAPTALYGGKAIGGYYYYYYHPQALCSMSDADTNTETSQVATMQSFLSTLEPAQ